MIDIYNELPLNRYIELYTSKELANEYKVFEDSIMKQKPLIIYLSNFATLILNWCIIDIDNWTGLAIHYKRMDNEVIVFEDFYYDDTFYSFAQNGIQQWSDIITSIVL